MAKTIKAGRSKDKVPVLVVVVDRNLTIKELNSAARQFLGTQYKDVLHKRNGEAFDCAHFKDAPGGCGHGGFCQVCPIREAATLASKEHRVVRRRTRAEVGKGRHRHEVSLLVTATPLPTRGSPRILLMMEDVTALSKLQSPTPICASCKRIRQDHAYWDLLVNHLSDQLDLDLSGGICPDCRDKLYAGFKNVQPLFFKQRARA